MPAAWSSSSSARRTKGRSIARRNASVKRVVSWAGHVTNVPSCLKPPSVYKPRRPQASPLFRLVSDHLQRLQTVYDERFAREYGPWRPVVAQVADKFLACGVLDHGFARIRCDACTLDYLLAFSCTCRYFCPSCPGQAPRDLDAVAGHDAPRAGAAPAGRAHHPQAAARLLSVPASPARRDRPRCCPHRHGRHPDADGRARPRRRHRRVPADARLPGELASAPAPARDRRRLPARRNLRHVARPRHRPVARGATAETYRSDKSEGPTAGTETVDPLEFLARVLVHIPDKGQVTTRYYGW